MHGRSRSEDGYKFTGHIMRSDKLIKPEINMGTLL